jgi:hypothetical protein
MWYSSSIEKKTLGGGKERIFIYRSEKIGVVLALAVLVG